MYEEGVTFGDSNELFFVLVKKDPDLAELEAFEKSEKQVAAGQSGASDWSTGQNDSLMASLFP